MAKLPCNYMAKVSYFHNIVFIRTSVFVVALAILFGCTKNQIKDDRMLPRVGHVNDIVELPYRTINLNSLLSGNKCPKFEVRLAKPVDIAKVWPEGIFEGTMYGVGLGAAGIGAALLYPMRFGACAVGGIILPPTMITMGIINSKNKSAVVEAFQEIDLPGRVHNLLEKNTSYFVGSQCNENTEIQLLIRGYGLFSDYSGYGLFSDCPDSILWFYCDADIIVKNSGEVVFKDSIIWRAQKRSKDAPPPRAETLDTFAKDNGKLTREMLIEAGEVLAAIVIKRLNIHD